MFLYQAEKCIIGILIALFENVLEIPGRLVCVNDEYQIKRREARAQETHGS